MTSPTPHSRSSSEDEALVSLEPKGLETPPVLAEAVPNAEEEKEFHEFQEGAPLSEGEQDSEGGAEEEVAKRKKRNRSQMSKKRRLRR